MFRKCSILIGLLLVSLSLAGFSGLFQATGQGSGIPWWVIILVLLVLLLGWWLLRRPEPEEETTPTAKAEAVAPEHAAEAPAPDDLTRIEGIGPKISSVFQAAGITTFAQLAATDVSRLKEVITEADILADVSTWSRQASLAAAGEWDALEALQDELKGGRRV